VIRPGFFFFLTAWLFSPPPLPCQERAKAFFATKSRRSDFFPPFRVFSISFLFFFMEGGAGQKTACIYLVSLLPLRPPFSSPPPFSPAKFKGHGSTPTSVPFSCPPLFPNSSVCSPSFFPAMGFSLLGEEVILVFFFFPLSLSIVLFYSFFCLSSFKELKRIPFFFFPFKANPGWPPQGSSFFPLPTRK